MLDWLATVPDGTTSRIAARPGGRPPIETREESGLPSERCAVEARGGTLPSGSHGAGADHDGVPTMPGGSTRAGTFTTPLVFASRTSTSCRRGLRVWHTPVESLSSVSEKHDVAFCAVRPAGRLIRCTSGTLLDAAGTVNEPDDGVNETGPATVQPGPAGSRPATDQW